MQKACGPNWFSDNAKGCKERGWNCDIDTYEKCMQYQTKNWVQVTLKNSMCIVDKSKMDPQELSDAYCDNVPYNLIDHVG